jgi:hypothetical protein
MGLFLHHLPTPLKAEFLRVAYRLLAHGGMVLAHDPVMGEDEDKKARKEMLRRFGYKL